MGFYNKAALDAPVYITAALPAAAGLQLTQYLFVSDGYYEIEAVNEVHDVVGSTNAALSIVKCASGTTPGSGVAILASSFDLTATADTPQRKVRNSGGLSATLSSLSLVPGDSLAAVYSGTLTGLLGVTVTIRLRRTRQNF